MSVQHWESDSLQLGDHLVVGPPILVREVVFDGLGQVQFGDLALLDALLADLLSNHSPAEVHERQRFGCKANENCEAVVRFEVKPK